MSHEGLGGRWWKGFCHLPWLTPTLSPQRSLPTTTEPPTSPAYGFQRKIQVGSLEKVAFGWNIETWLCTDGRKPMDAEIPRTQKRGA